MENYAENRRFWITYMSDMNFEKVILASHHELMRLLNELSINDYSSEIANFIVIFVAFGDEVYPEKDKLFFRRKKKEIEIRINIDREKALQANENDFANLKAQTYLRAIEQFLSKRKDFDWKKFYQDVKQKFIEHQFLQA